MGVITKSIGKGIGKLKINIDKAIAIQGMIDKRYSARVGILGNNARKDETDMTNAQVGAIHEFGSRSRNIPERSFLRYPLKIAMPKKSAVLGKAYMKAIEAQDVKQAYEVLGNVGRGVVLSAFRNKGYGRWRDLSPVTVAAKKGKDTPLIDSGELRKSISYDVKANVRK